MFEIGIQFLVFLLLNTLTVPAMVCPDISVIDPCTCLNESPYERIYCEDSEVTQEIIDRTIRNLIVVNNMTANDESTWIRLDKFRVKNSLHLMELDLSGLSMMTIRAVQAYDNTNLVRIYAGSNSNKKINVTEVIFYSNKLKSESLVDFLPYITDTLNRMDLSQNEIEYLPSFIFEEFLTKFTENKIHGMDNPFICDQRMKWLKDGRKMYESRVTNINCVNDVGNNVFNTTMIY